MKEMQDEALCALGEKATEKLDVSQENLFCEPGFLHLSILRKALKSLTEITPH